MVSVRDLRWCGGRGECGMGDFLTTSVPAANVSDFYCDEALSGRTPVKVVMQTETVLAFEHTRPSYPVHIVVVPKQHVPSLVNLGDAGEEVLMDVFQMVRKVAAMVREEHGAACVVTNEGDYQESKHLHVHVLWRGDLPEGRA
ncbi:histidine triad (HIT) family protein [Catenuloplanes atrovinosus]|uniref:Histidine triad (HIT) family protein n=2 Tax=Catenuloplanes atrovinosus TaxID=137266 RepID=A0AAE3YSS8_9ACTN|nr:histidine triad (HIT) family protein [Catenuloplanes atrovinosus]